MGFFTLGKTLCASRKAFSVPQLTRIRIRFLTYVSKSGRDIDLRRLSRLMFPPLVLDGVDQLVQHHSAGQPSAYARQTWADQHTGGRREGGESRAATQECHYPHACPRPTQWTLELSTYGGQFESLRVGALCQQFAALPQFCDARLKRVSLHRNSRA
ncbi:MAG TPA: hypothetical protein VLV87_00095 [Gammaproteobacteria bacterium]|nr:hypothetical protein [Gammaproteobacteria bacterium]